MSQDRVVATLPLNRRKEIRVALRDKFGLLSVDLRVHASNGRMFVPTSGGLAIRAEMLDDVIRALTRARDEVDVLERGGER